MPPTPVQPHRNEAVPVAWNRVGEMVPPFVPTLGPMIGCEQNYSCAAFISRTSKDSYLTAPGLRLSVFVYSWLEA
jgi:hypothetical protein